MAKSASRPSVASRPSAQTVALLVLLGLGILLVFWPVARCGFLNYDDDGYVTDNAHVRTGLSVGNVLWAFGAGETGNWHPITWLSLMWDAQMYGLVPYGFHLTNLVLHIANTLLLFLVLKKLAGRPWPAAMVAALFGLHPLHVESVAWISERKDVLSALFFMLTLLCYARYVSSTVHSPRSTVGGVHHSRFTIHYLLALLFFALGLMSKPMLVTVPFVLLLLDFWPLTRVQGSEFKVQSWGRLVREKIPFFVLSAASCVITFIVQKKGDAVQSLALFPMSMRVENAILSYGRYLGKVFWPVDLAMPYPYPVQIPSAAMWMTLALLAGVSGWALYHARRFPFLFTGWMWFLGMLVPVIGLVQVGAQAMADRYTYLPLIGFFIAVVFGLDAFIRGLRVPQALVIALAGAVLTVLSARTRTQIGYWQDSETLFRRAIAVTRDNAEAYEHLGTYHLRIRNDLTNARDCYQRAVGIAPGRISARVNLGSALLLAGDGDGAAEQFEAVLRMAPGDADANCDLGYLFAARGQFDQAIACYDAAIQSRPDFSSAYHDRGLAFAAKGQWDNAVRDYREAIRLDPAHVSTHVHLGTALAQQGNTDAAAREFAEALRLDPGNPEAQRQLESLQR